MSKTLKKETSKSGGDTQKNAADALLKKRVPIKELGLSISTNDRGFIMAPEAFLMCQEMFVFLFEKFDEKMMAKQVERDYKRYSITNAIQTAMNAINISNMTNDKGDSFKDYPIYDYEPYNYEEES